MMRMDMTPEQNLQVAVQLAQSEIVELQEQQKELRQLIDGGSDPRKGLLWLCMNQGELLTTLSKLVTAQADALAAHKEQPHPGTLPPQSLWEKLKYDAIRQVVIIAIAAVMVLLVIGALTYIRNGGKF